MDVRVGDEHVLPGVARCTSARRVWRVRCVACAVCSVWRVRCAGVACAVCGVQRKAHHAPLWKLDLALGQVGRPAAWRVEAVSARVVQAVFGFECRNHYPCGGAAHSRLRIDPAGSSAEVGARLGGLTQHPAVVGHEDARALRCGCQDAHCERAPQQCARPQGQIQSKSRRPLDCSLNSQHWNCLRTLHSSTAELRLPTIDENRVV